MVQYLLIRMSQSFESKLSPSQHSKQSHTWSFNRTIFFHSLRMYSCINEGAIWERDPSRSEQSDSDFGRFKSKDPRPIPVAMWRRMNHRRLCHLCDQPFDTPLVLLVVLRIRREVKQYISRDLV